MNKLMQFSFLLALGAFTLFTACEKEDLNVTEDVEFYVNSSVFDLEERGNCGRFGCYAFVFPISIQFPDSSTAEVEDYENLRTTIRDWKEANPNTEGRPNLAFPLEVMDDEGNVISVASREELTELRLECRKEFFQKRRDKRGKHRGGICFKPVFPISVSFPDGTTFTADSPRALKEEIRSWRRDNRGSEERPGIVFPIQVQYEDGTIVDVGSSEEFKALREACSEDEEG